MLTAQTRIRSATIALGLIVVLAGGISGCSRSPAEEMDLWGSSWSVLDVGDVTIPSGEITITFPSAAGLDQAATIRTACRTVAVGVSWDYSNDAMSFSTPPPLASSCAGGAVVRDQVLARAIDGVTTWSIESSQEVSLHGSVDVRLRMV
jgi:hypothetical protein